VVYMGDIRGQFGHKNNYFCPGSILHRHLKMLGNGAQQTANFAPKAILVLC